MPEEALLETVEVEQPLEEAHETSETDAGSDGETGSASESQSVQDAPELVGSALWRDLKGPLYSGKALNKAQIKSVQRMAQLEQQISSKYPNGLGEVESTLASIQALRDEEGVPIEQAIQETLQERSYFRELDDLYTRGDAKFIEKMVEASPEAFENLAPGVIRKYAELNPEGYSTQVAQAVMQHMNTAEVPLQFRILATFLPQLADGPAKDQVISACDAIFGWSEGMKALSQKKIEPKAVPQAQSQPNQGPDAQTQQIDLTRREWNLSLHQEGLNLVLSEAQKEVSALKKAALSEPEKKKVLGKVSEELDTRLMMDKKYGVSMQGFLRAGNRASYTQMLQSKRKTIVPAAVKRAVQDVLAERPAKTAQTQAKPTAQPQTQTLKPAQGAVQFRKISGPPQSLKMVVDLNRTTNSMLVKRQAYIKGEERPVSWARV